MNARQKAKKLKKNVRNYKAEANIWKQYADAWEKFAKNEATKRHELAARIKSIYFFKLISSGELEYAPEDIIKRSLATEIGLALIDANLVSWKTEEVPEMCFERFTATVEVLTQEEKE